ncbi:DoxX family protein [Nocardioides jiangxiensis]|uniref:DoxX family protein n=1 Tax=Nocardioides jiangxiensis TaxID=3064524 RepID=A0ABT9B3G6_9ACTN|nr:DoxX family protein [Nocardioides sp. WY-20]MDO7868859.1 DoxX family protein [Nocardioides sp. WY-20]
MALGTIINSTRRNLALLGVRVLLGAVLVAHGWQKLHDWGIAGTRSSFADMGIPNAGPAATFAVVAELGGGALILLGLCTPLAALLVAADMAGAFWFVHRGTEVFVGDGGWELVAGLGAAALALFAVGAGALSVDALLLGWWRRRRARKARLKPAKPAPAPTHNVLGEELAASDA